MLYTHTHTHKALPKLFLLFLIPTHTHTHTHTHITVVLFYAIALAAYVDLDQDFAGFFSLNGGRYDGCLSYGFGIALAAFLVNTIATAIGFVAICYRWLWQPQPLKYKYSVQ